MKRIMQRRTLAAVSCAAAFLFPGRAHAMHVTEGILPPAWAGFWFLVALPFLALGMRELRVRSGQAPRFKALVGLVGAAVFVLSCMPIPVPIAGSCSHPCGTGLAAILIGPGITVVVASAALLLQALFLAHGGLTTLGGNVVSMGVAGAYLGAGAFFLARKARVPWFAAAFLAGLASDWGTYATTSLELSLALAGDGRAGSLFLPILAAFAPTQVPLGIFEGFLAAGAYRVIRTRRPELVDLPAEEGAA